jgi:CheY-like chemotaxis protein
MNVAVHGAEAELGSDRPETSTPEDEVLILGRMGRDTRNALEDSLEQLGGRLRVHQDPDQARNALAHPHAQAPKCIFVDAHIPNLESFISWVRGEARLFSVPVVVQADAPTDAAYLQAHSLGADDAIIRGDMGAITRRLANLDEFDPSVRPPVTQGRAVIAYPDGTRRRVLGRILRQAGFDLAFAADSHELVERAEHGDPPVLVVATEDLPPSDAIQAITDVRRATGNDELPGVILGNKDAEADLRREAEALGTVGVGKDGAPADNLLFLANELLRPGVKNVRASARLLYGTICGFRPAGSLGPTFGLTYNLSREGLYVRTLDPPAPGTDLWFEMRPPYEAAAVHLRGRVMWSRGLRNPGGAAPPGFGMRIDPEGCPPGDLESYRTSYDALRDELLLSE